MIALLSAAYPPLAHCEFLPTGEGARHACATKVNPG